jgi:hypothetical protein
VLKFLFFDNFGVLKILEISGILKIWYFRNFVDLKFFNLENFLMLVNRESLYMLQFWKFRNVQNLKFRYLIISSNILSWKFCNVKDVRIVILLVFWKCTYETVASPGHGQDSTWPARPIASLAHVQTRQWSAYPITGLADVDTGQLTAQKSASPCPGRQWSPPIFREAHV